MSTHARQAPVYEYDHSLDWTENSKRKAYALVAATDQDVLAYATSGIAGPPVESTEADALIKWTRDEAAETVKYFETEHEKVVADAEADREPIDAERAVRLGTETARKQNASGNLPFMIETGPEAVAYAADRLKSKIERNAVYNPITEVHAALLSYRFLKTMPDGEKVVYIDRYKRRQAVAREPSVAQAPEPNPKPVKTVEWMFQQIGFLDSKPREFLIKGLIPRNEVCNPFGRPDSFKGVTGAQLVVHIAGGVDFLGSGVKQAPTAYFAAERGEQVKRRIKGHIQRLGLPYDLPCYFGGKPIDLLVKADLDFLIASIKAIERDAGAALGFLVVDAQSRTMGGDENSTRDGAAYAKAIEAIRQATDATLWIIAHSGHSEDAQDRPRGSSALLGAYDTFYRHKKIDERRGEIKITIDRDGLGGKELPFVVELYDTGTVNEDGEAVLVPYLDPAAPAVKFAFKKGDEQVRPTPGETLMLKALRAAIKNSDRQVRAEDASGDLLEGAKHVTGAEWRDEFRALYKTGSSRQAESQAFAKGRDGLIAKGCVGARGSCYWPTVTAPS